MFLGKLFNQPLGACCTPYGNVKKEMAIPLAVPLISAGAGLLGKLWGNSQAADAERERQRMLQAEKAKSDAYYRRMINQNFTDTAYGQNWMRIARDEADKIWKREAGATAVTGRTAAADAMAKDAANKIVGDAIAQGESQEAMRKDNLEASKRAADSQFAQQEMADAAAKRDRLSAAGDAILSTGLNIAATTFGGTKLGQSWFGSPGGGGGATDATPTSQLQTMGTNNVQMTPEMQIANAMKNPSMFNYLNYSPGYDSSYLGNMFPNIKLR